MKKRPLDHRQLYRNEGQQAVSRQDFEVKKRSGNVLLTWRFHKYEAVFCCKVFNINTLVYGLLVFSQTMRILVQHKRKFFIKKVLRKCRKSAVFRNFAGKWRFCKSAVFRNFAGKWRFYTYATVIYPP